MNDRRSGFLQTWLSVFLWMLFIFVLSSVPGREIPDLPIPFFHKVVHFIEYSVLGLLWIRAFIRSGSNVKFLKLVVLAWALSTAFACSDEWHQTFVPGRSGKIEDVYFDVICAALGIGVYILFQKKLKPQDT